MKKILLTLLFTSVLLNYSYTQGSITTDGGSVFIDFDNTTAGILMGSFDASGISTTPAAGGLDEDGVNIIDDIPGTADVAASFGAGTTTNNSFQGTSNGGETASGVYAFNVASSGTDRVFGMQPSGSRWGDKNSDDGQVVFKIDNNSGMTFTAFQVSYDLYELNNEGRTTTVEAYFTDDASTPNYGAVQATYTTPELANISPAWTNAFTGSFTLTGFNVPNGASVFLRFYVFDGPASGGSRDEIGIDNIRVVGASTETVLPVELIDFKAVVEKENKVELVWKTASEIDNAGFEIEKSSNSKVWKNISFVKGNGTTLDQQTYHFTDETPLKGINYYRLKQIDFNGEYEYSEVVAVNIGAENTISIAPTLAQNELDIRVTGKANLIIMNAAGIKVKQLVIMNRQTINIADLMSGTYFLLVEMNGRTEALRFMKQ